MQKVDLIFIGGHHTCAIPIIKEFINKKKKILFIGHKFSTQANTNLSSEFKEISSLSIPYFHFKAPKFYAVKGCYKYLFFAKSFLYATYFLIKNRPKVLVSFGGYLAVPLVLSAKLLAIKVVTHEQTVSVGLANKVISFFADRILLTWESSLDFYKNKKNVYVVGLPLRSEITNAKVKEINKNHELKNLFIQGGKQGSHIINKFIFDNIDYLVKNYTIYHQTSSNSTNSDFEISKNLELKYKGRYLSFDFLYGNEYTKILNICDFAISRSGAHIVYEFSYLKFPSIFIPISWSSQNEQFENAKMSQKYLPSVILNETELNISLLSNSIKSLETKINSSQSYLNVESASAEKMVFYIEELF